jgi:hypothetical protein
VKQLNFDLVILGNEPAGLWLAEQYAKLSSGASVAWIPLQEQSSPLPLLTSIANRFSILDSAPEDFIEFISSAGAHSTEPKFFQENPRREVLLQCLWKSFSRTQSITAEPFLRDKVLPLTYAYWDPSRSLSRQLTHYSVPQGGQYVERAEINPDKSLTLVFKNLGAIRSQKWIINCSLGDWKTLTQALSSELELFNPEMKLFNPSWTVPIEATVSEQHLNQSLKPLSVLIESEHLPHPLYEAWTLEAGKVQAGKRKLRLWIDLPPDHPPSDLNKWSEKAWVALMRLFPFLKGQSFELTENPSLARERYRSSLLSPYTRHPFLFCLGPYVNCQLPYPEGPLESAQKLLRNWLGSTKQTKLA